MLKSCRGISNLLACLRRNKDGVLSFEYVIVAACIVASVTPAFSTTASGGIGTALTNAIAAISTSFTAA